MSDWHRAVLWVRPKPKPRPRGGKGHFYLPKDFQDWRTEMVQAIHDAGFPAFEGPVKLYVAYGSESTSVEIHPIEDYQRAKHVRADLDNLLGGTFEAFQDAKVLDNDSQVVEINAGILNRRGGP